MPPVEGIVEPSLDFVTAQVNGAVATVTWETDIPATSFVEYGLSPSLGLTAPGLSDLTLQHSVDLTGLTPGETYFYRAVSIGTVGNAGKSQYFSFAVDAAVTGPASVSGDLVAWHPISLDLRGVPAGESDPSPNPFLDYRLIVTFTGPSGQIYEVPGFFAGNGAGGTFGDIWRTRFAADEGGEWSYSASFRSGSGIAVSTDPEAGVPGLPDGASGTIAIAARDPEAEGFLAKGRLQYVGAHYLRFAEGGWFVKGGTDSPENLLAFRGFDNTFDQPGGLSTTGLQNGLHSFEPHVADFVPGDPSFVSADTGEDSHGIIGALNYLASVHVNSAYFLPMNLGGDGREVYPFTGPIDNAFDKTHYDISKLGQWNQVFEHAMRLGIQLQFVLGETETGNENWLDNGSLGVERKLFYREMVARFGHHLAIKWNLSEESDFSTSELRDFADFIRAIDPYDHPIAFHTDYLPSNGDYDPYDAVLGDPRFSLTSIQGASEHAGSHVEKWREKSASAGHRWVVDIDELGPAGEGLTDANAATRRKTALWDVYLSGGHVEWYAGYHPLPLGGDLRLEDFRTREEMWNYTWYARRFLEENLRFWEMVPEDELVTGESGSFGGAEVLAKVNDSYAVYFPEGSSTGSIDLSETSGSFVARWFNPRTGNFVGDDSTVTGGGSWAVGPPPHSVGNDWVWMLKRP